MRKFKVCKYLVISLAIFAGGSPVLAGPEKYLFDKPHTEILFSVKHFGFYGKTGRFSDYDGYYIFDQKHPEKSAVDIIIKPSGIQTFSKILDKFLQTKTWFNTKQYPEIHFKSLKILLTGKNTASISGSLTLLGQKHPIILNVKLNHSGLHEQTKEYVSGFSADTVINRAQFGMTNLIPIVGENVKLHIEVEGIQNNNHIKTRG